MICTKKSGACGGKLKVSHTYSAAEWKFQRAVCLKCGSVYRLTVTATPVAARGEGARAFASRYKDETTCGTSSPF